LDFDDLVTALEPPPNRVGKSDGLHEHRLYEGAVMLAYAMYLLRTQGVRDVRIHPDGEHGKQFDFTSWLGQEDYGHMIEDGLLLDDAEPFDALMARCADIAARANRAGA
jgi:hypothetical protein